MPSESTRHRLYEEIQEVLSPESADELMGYLPPVGWADVATKADVDTLRTELRGDLAMAVGQLKGEIADGMKQLHRWILGSSFSVGGLVLAAVHLGS